MAWPANKRVPSILERIIAVKREEVRRRKQRRPLSRLKAQLPQAPPVRSLRQQLLQPGFHLLCEIKKASPSRGLLQPVFRPVERALAYQRGGAVGISVLTDEPFFQGSLQDLEKVRQVVNLPVLRKDFILDPYQVYESRMAGADVLLLIASVLSAEQLSDLSTLAGELGMDVLIEVHHEEELANLPRAPHIIVGINNRNLHNFTVSLETSLRLRPFIPRGIPVISESGISQVEQCRRLYGQGFSGALIGEWLMRAADPEREVRKLIRGTTGVHTN